jgi:hypothetical protein
MLAARSEYFRAMFGGKMIEATLNVIDIDVSYDCFIKGLEFIYTSTMNIYEITSDTALELIELVKNEYF